MSPPSRGVNLPQNSQVGTVHRLFCSSLATNALAVQVLVANFDKALSLCASFLCCARVFIV